MSGGDPRPSPSTPPDAELVSVVVPCRNEHAHIRACIADLLGQQLPEGWRLEILVADGLSDDGTREILAELESGGHPVRTIDNPGRIVSTGLNAAIAASRGTVVIRIDVHTSYDREYLARCLETLDATGADNVGGPWVAEGRGPVSRAVAAAFASPIAMGGARGHDPNYEGPVDTVYLGCWRRELFDRLGGFDEGLVRNQDDEYNLRINRAGGTVYQSPTIRSRYLPRASLRKLWRQYQQYGYWKVAVIRKHRLPASFRHLVPSALVAWLVLGWLPALLWPPWWWVFGGAVALYLSAVLSAALGCLSRAGSATILVPAVVVTMHLAYGCGFLSGCFDALRGRFGSGESVRSLTR